MKLLNRNVGLYYRLKYLGKPLGYTIKGITITHPYFNHGNLKCLQGLVQTHQPDVAIFQEVVGPDDTAWLADQLGYQYYDYTTSWYHDHGKGFFSTTPFEKHEVSFEGETGCWYVTDDAYYFPVHFHAFSSNHRLRQALYIQSVVSDLGDDKPVLVAGDFNIWQYKQWFLFANDRAAMKILASDCDDYSPTCATTTSGATLDKIFVKHCDQIKTHTTTVLETRGQYMDHYPVLFEREAVSP